MSILVKQFKSGSYGLWQTITDSYLTFPTTLSREQAIEVLVKRWRKKMNEDIKELKKTFPKGWCDKDTLKII